MTTRDYIELILSVLGGIGAILFGLGYFYSQFKEGSTKNRLDTINILKSDVQTLRDEVANLTNKVEMLTKEIETKDKKLGEALAILQGRNPEMEKFIVTMTQYMEDMKPFIENVKMRVIPVVTKLDKYLDGKEIK